MYPEHTPKLNEIGTPEVVLTATKSVPTAIKTIQNRGYRS